MSILENLIELAVYKGKREQTKKIWEKEGIATEKELEELEAEIKGLDGEIQELKQKIMKDLGEEAEEFDNPLFL